MLSILRLYKPVQLWVSQALVQHVLVFAPQLAALARYPRSSIPKPWNCHWRYSCTRSYSYKGLCWKILAPMYVKYSQEGAHTLTDICRYRSWSTNSHVNRQDSLDLRRRSLPGRSLLDWCIHRNLWWVCPFALTPLQVTQRLVISSLWAPDITYANSQFYVRQILCFTATYWGFISSSTTPRRLLDLKLYDAS